MSYIKDSDTVKARRKYYSSIRGGAKYYHQVKEKMARQLSQEGFIQLSDVLAVCGSEIGYTILGHAFRSIMEEMIDAGKAIMLKRGRYRIIETSEFQGNDDLPKQRKPRSYTPEPQYKLTDPDKWPKRVGAFYSNVYQTYLNE